MSEGDDYQSRVKTEHNEVLGRLSKLTAFIDTTPFHKLDMDDQVDLRIQLTYMTGYAGVLAKRINRFNARN